MAGKKKSRYYQPKTKPQNKDKKPFDFIDKIIAALVVIGAVLASAFGSDSLHTAMVSTVFLTISIALFDIFRHSLHRWRWAYFTLLVAVTLAACIVWDVRNRQRPKPDAQISKVNTPEIPQGDPPVVSPPAPPLRPSNSNVAPSNKNSEPPHKIKPEGNNNSKPVRPLPPSPEDAPKNEDRPKPQRDSPFAYFIRYGTSTDPRFSDAVEVIVTTTMELPRFHFRLDCDGGEIGWADTKPARSPNTGVFAFRQGPTQSGYSIHTYEIESETPFTPSGPLSITLLSKGKLTNIRLTAVP